jgi:hypothetical protein
MAEAAGAVVEGLEAMKGDEGFHYLMYAPEGLQLRLDWSKRRVEAELVGLAGTEERVRRLGAYRAEAEARAREVDARKDIDACAAAIHAARYAAAEAAYLEAREQAGGSGSRGVSNEERAAARRMSEEAQATVAGLEEIEEIRPRSPEFTGLRLLWDRKASEAATGVSSGKADWQGQIRALSAGLDYLEERGTTVTCEGGRYELQLFRYGRAELTLFKQVVAEDPGERQAAIKELLATSEEAVDYQNERNAISAFTLPRLVTKLNWIERRRRAEVVADPSPAGRRRAEERYLEEVGKAVPAGALEERVEKVVDGMIRHARAEAAYRRAVEGG